MLQTSDAFVLFLSGNGLEQFLWFVSGSFRYGIAGTLRGNTELVCYVWTHNVLNGVNIKYNT